MAEEIKQDHNAAYLPVDIASLLREWNEGETVGKTSRVAELDDVFKWMPGTINGWYGWANDGKGTFFDFMAVMNAHFDEGKFCMMKQEDVSSTRYKNDKPKITANRIHKNLVWAKTGQTPYKHFAVKHGLKQLPKDEYMAALEWVEEHFFIVYPRDRRYRNVLDLFKFMYEKYGINHFLIDPAKSLKFDSDKRTDFMMDDFFIDCKEFVLETNTDLHIIAHPKSMTDQKDKDGRYKVVNQFMIAGGASWDNNMDSQYSIYRPERHLNPSDPKVHFHNLKQRNAEEVLAGRGSYEDIKFDKFTKRYFFNGVCPLDGSQAGGNKNIIDFTQPKVEAPILGVDELPF